MYHPQLALEDGNKTVFRVKLVINQLPDLFQSICFGSQVMQFTTLLACNTVTTQEMIAIMPRQSQPFMKLTKSKDI